MISCTSFDILKNSKIKLNVWNCNNLNIDSYEEDNIINELFIVGHAYGDSNSKSLLSDNVMNYFNKTKNKNADIALTGDFVYENTQKKLREVNTYLKNNFRNYFIAAGNHDLFPDTKNYYAVFKEDFFSFEYNNFLLISANYSNSDWLPNEEQQKKINTLINESSKEIVILLSHQIFWQNEANFEMNPNSYELLTKKLSENSLEWIEDSNKYYIVISGDYGLNGSKTVCFLNDNTLFIANGVGNHKNDTILRVFETKNNLIIEEVKLP